ncbi:MAG: hypothetical protein O3A53_20875 [Acidobacteria bacterium]|nr:hypothetical protein [Acidobacteriota bacterium]
MLPAVRLLLLGSLLGLPLGAESSIPVTDPQITVRLYDYANMAQEVLERARRQAAHIYRRAGLRLSWEICPISDDAARENRDCSRRADAATIRMSILSKIMAKKMANKSTEFGYAVALANGHGVIAGIFYERTVREADSVGIARHTMLGHTIAHEIGHLLLGPGSHSTQGIMTPNWTQREIYLAGMNTFVFTESQATKIKAQARARNQEAAVQWAERNERPSGRNELTSSDEIAWISGRGRAKSDERALTRDSAH